MEYLKKGDNLQLEDYLNNLYPDPLDDHFKAEVYQFILISLFEDNSCNYEEKSAWPNKTEGNKSNESAAASEKTTVINLYMLEPLLPSPTILLLLLTLV